MLQGSSVDGSGEAGNRRTKEASSSVDFLRWCPFQTTIPEVSPKTNRSKKRSCTACTQAGETCQSTLPRKQPIHQLSLRYRMLDHLVRQLFPDRNLETLDDLKSLASEAGFKFKRYLKATEFTSFRISQALEKRIWGRPATNVTEDVDEHVDGTGETSGGAHNHERSAYKSPLASSTTRILGRKHVPLLDLLPETNPL
ncbi:hypothetical protein K435DRAFT_842651 [Dendrothele bispora CBS 962.96]|uniref:Uncharacterized protein n=1 Tax=Dendrothele bispora (strain CBS 962.96) TaxID=1314807 RepID=A0A4S8LEM5_DENBC|nr:hypothetical protein K435DRAFT_842651 [Dendrothele bispora CBS 962.96]